MIFEVDKEYFVTYGTIDDTSHDQVRVIEVNGEWVRFEGVRLND